MAGALVLVRCDLELVDPDIAAAGLAQLHTRYRTAVHSSLTRASLQLLEKAYEVTPFPAVVSGRWDPWRALGAIQDYYVLSEEEIQSVVEGTKATYEPVNWDQYEDEAEEAYKARIKEGWKGPMIAIVWEREVRTWLEQNGEEVDEVPAVVVWQAGQVQQRWSWDSWTEEYSKAVSPSKEELRVEPVAIPAIPPVLQDSEPLSIPVLLSNSLLSLTSEFSSQLAYTLQSALLTLHPSSPDPLSSALQAAVSALVQLEEQAAASLGNLEGRIRDVDRFKDDQERELKEMEEKFSEIREKQREVEALLIQLGENLQPTVASLRSQLASLKSSQDCFSQELLSAQALLFPAFPLTFLALSLTNSVLRITLHSRKYYPLYGYLAIYKDNVGIWCKPDYDTFQLATTTIEFRDLPVDWNSGEVEVAVIHFADAQRELVQRGKVRKEGEYEQSYLHQRVGNVRQVEEKLEKVRGAEGLEVFRWLAVRWSNPTESLIDPFMQSFLDSAKSLSQLQPFLQSQGLTFL